MGQGVGVNSAWWLEAGGTVWRQLASLQLPQQEYKGFFVSSQSSKTVSALPACR